MYNVVGKIANGAFYLVAMQRQLVGSSMMSSVCGGVSMFSYNCGSTCNKVVGRNFPILPSIGGGPKAVGWFFH